MSNDNETQLESFKRTAKELECDESDDALDKAAGKVLRPSPPPETEPDEKERPAE